MTQQQQPTFAEVLRATAAVTRRTLPQLAADIGVPYNTLMRWLYRHNQPDPIKRGVLLERCRALVAAMEVEGNAAQQQG